MQTPSVQSTGSIFPEIWRVLGDCRCLFRAVVRSRALDPCNESLGKFWSSKSLKWWKKQIQQKRGSDVPETFCFCFCVLLQRKGYLGVAIQRDCIGIGVVFFSAVDLRVKSSLWTPQVKVWSYWFSHTWLFVHTRHMHPILEILVGIAGQAHPWDVESCSCW